MTNPNLSNTASSQTIATRTGLHEIRKANEQLLQNLLNGSLILGTVLFFLNMYNAIQKANYLAVAGVIIAYAILFIITFARMLPFRLRVDLLAASYYLVGTLSLITSGVSAGNLIYFFITVLVIALLLEKNAWIIPFAIATLTITLVGFFSYFSIINTEEVVLASTGMIEWLSIAVNLLYTTFLISASTAQYFERLRTSIISTHQRDEALANENAVLSSKLLDFQNTLDRRRSRLVTTRQISREISQQTDIEKVMKDSVELIRTQLGYYHAAIYLNDNRNENAMLKAATGDAGQMLMERNYRIRVRDEGVIGSSIFRGEPIITENIEVEFPNFKNTSLPNTKAEIALPLRIGQNVFGALDVHADRVQAFADEDIEILQSITDQLSMVIDKNFRLGNLNATIQRLEESYRSYTRGSWQTHLKGSKKQLSYTYTENTLEPEFDETEITRNALESGEVITAQSASKNVEDAESILAVPIMLRNQVLGVMNIKYKGKSIPSDLADLAQNASDRLAVALENARLLEQNQQRAEREHLVGEISTRVRSASDIDTILRTTATELGRALGIDEVRIQLKNAE
ncbi:MAG: GAF domain-containing protein [Anaerolineaceae bacterium]|nr:GAF domain-containing protein [Anaerolineaceae bacterium]